MFFVLKLSNTLAESLRVLCIADSRERIFLKCGIFQCCYSVLDLN